MNYFLFIIITSAFLYKISCCDDPINSYIINLNSDNNNGRWTVQNENGSILVAAIVPGGIYSDLLRNKQIEDLYLEDNDVKLRWISKTTWTYSRTFNISRQILDKNTVDLVMHGLDTIAYISLNSHPVLSTDNMFVRYKINVKNALKEGLNVLSIQFDSSVNVAALRSQKQMIPPECVPDLYNGECHVNQLRKMQASFSWDWGPAFPSVGIWKPVNLEAYNIAIIRDITTNLELLESESTWLLTLKIFFDVSNTIAKLEGHLIATIDLDNEEKFTSHTFIQDNITQGKLEKELTMQIHEGNVKRWWPNGYGEQNLYKIRITFQSTQFAREYFYKDIKIGFKTLELIQEPLETPQNQSGLTFYFKVNDYPMFMKGSNWIPANILPELGYLKQTVDHLLESANAAHMNMLRVWGGGVYESDYFYEKCDELGILIWQDFMFACSMYPVDAQYLRSVSTEVEQVVRRLQHHASIALWAGNNENEAALRGNWYNTSKDFNKYKEQYIIMYVDTIKPIVARNDPDHSYVVSSPSNGLQSEKEGYIARNPYDPHYGDTHYYNYLEDLWSMDTFVKTRFSSEYGFQSLPSLETLSSSTTNAEDLMLESIFLKHRQHLLGGYEYMSTQIMKHMTLPNKNDSNSLLKYVYKSQVTQAMAMKAETEFYRQSQYDWKTMGALYWQLNDVWQAPSWSSIEFSGKWKMLHYFARNFFNPVLISPRLYPTNDVYIFLINDQMAPIINATVLINTFNWANLAPIATTQWQVNLQPMSIEKIDSRIVLPLHEERNKIFYTFLLRDGNGDKLSPDNYIFPVNLKDIIGYKKPSIKLKLNGRNRGVNNIQQYDVIVESNGIGLFVWIDIKFSDGWFSDNGFIMTESLRHVTLYLKSEVKPEILLNNINVMCLDI